MVQAGGGTSGCKPVETRNVTPEATEERHQGGTHPVARQLEATWEEVRGAALLPCRVTTS